MKNVISFMSGNLSSVLAVSILILLTGCWGNLTESINEDVLAFLNKTVMEVSVGSIELAGGSGVYTFPDTILIDGDTNAGVSGDVVFTITNTGDIDLSTIAVGALSGTNAGDFDLDTAGLLTSLIPGDSTSFTIRFDPVTDAGTLSANVTVTSLETGNMTFLVNGTADWWGIKTIQSTGNVGSFTSLTVDGNDVYIVYVEETDLDPWSYDVENLYMTVSENQGETWGAPVVIENSSTLAHLYPSIKAVNGIAYVSYLQMIPASDDDLRFAKSLNKGLTWQDMQTIVHDGSFSQGWYSNIEVMGNTVYITSYDQGFIGENMGLLFVRSDDGGITFEGVEAEWNKANGYPYFLEYVDWEDAVPINEPVGLYPSLAVSGDRVYIGYFVDGGADLTDHVRVKVSIDNGETWDVLDGVNPAILNEVDTPGWDFTGFNDTDISVNGSTVYFMYTDSTTSRIMFTRSDDSGETWPAGNIKTVDTTSDVYGWAGMAVSGSNIYIAYYDVTNDPDNWDLMLNKSTDGGTTWPATGVTVDGGSSGDDVGAFLDITAIGDSVYISYYDWVTGDLKYAKSIDGGVTW